LPRLASSAPCTPTLAAVFCAVSSPNATSGRNALAGISAVAPNDVWAAGFYVNASLVYQTLAEHWDGTAWSIVTTPNVGPGNNLFTAVTAVGPGDVWAVGYYRPGTSGPATPLTEHWNGNGWTVVATPVPPSSTTYLYSVAPDPSGDVFAVGISIDLPVTSLGPRGHPFALQRNGGSWSVFAAATPYNQAGPLDVSSLNAVKVFSPTDVWVAGDGLDYTGSTPSSPDTAFIQHWNGSSWTQYTLPAHPNGDFLVDVQGTSNDLWAVGGQGQPLSSTQDNVLIEHWNGSSWAQYTLPAHPNGDFLVDVQGTSNDLWAVGGQGQPLSNTQDNVLIEHWNGTVWSDSGGVTPDMSANLFGLGYLAADNVYAVGASAYANPGTTLETDHAVVERWNGTSWSKVTSADPSTNDDLVAIAAISAIDIWTSGFMTVNQAAQTLTENYSAPPTVTNVVPSTGNAGNSVVITGTGFSRAIDVEFGATPAFSFHVDSDTQITAVSPGHKAGVVDITVSVQATSATASADQFTYLLSVSGAAPAAPGSGAFQNRTLLQPPPVPAAPPHPRLMSRYVPTPI
jgi:hypothetical protein